MSSLLPGKLDHSITSSAASDGGPAHRLTRLQGAGRSAPHSNSARSWGVGRCGGIEKTSLISLTSRRGGRGHTWTHHILACKRAQETDADGLPPRLVRRNRGHPTGVSVVRFPAGVMVIGTDIGRLSSCSCGTCPKASRGSNDTMVEGASRKRIRVCAPVTGAQARLKERV